MRGSRRPRRHLRPRGDILDWLSPRPELIEKLMMLLDRALQRNIDGVLVPHHRNLATRPALPLAQTVPSDATLNA